MIFKRVVLQIVLFGMLVLAACGNPQTADELFSKAMEAFLNKQIKAAEIYVRQAIEAEPNNLAARLLHGEILLRSNDFGPAEIELRKALALDTNSDAGNALLAESLLAQEKIKQLENYRIPAGLSLDTRIRILMYQAEGLMLEGRLNEANKKIVAAKRLSPESPWIPATQAHLKMFLSRWDDALALLKNAVAVQPESANAWELLGNVYLIQGDYDSAIEAYHHSADNTYVPGRQTLKLALAYLYKGRFEEAESLYRDLTALYPRAPLVNYLGGVLAYKAGDYSLAQDRLQVALSEDFVNIPALYLAAAAYAQTGSTEVAHTYMNKVSQRAPKQMKNYVALLTAFIALHEGDIASATENLDQAKSIPSAYVQVLQATVDTAEVTKGGVLDVPEIPLDLILGLDKGGVVGLSASTSSPVGTSGDADSVMRAVVSAVMKKDFEGARELAKSYLAKNPEEPRSYMITAFVEMASNNPSMAERDYKAALSLDGNYTPAMKSLGALYFKQGQADKAAELYRKVASLEPDNAEVYLAVASAELAQSNSGEAIKWLEKAVALKPGDLQPSLFLARALSKNNQGKRALEFLKGKESLFSDEPEYLVLLADTAWQQNDKDLALSCYEKLSAISPNDPLIPYRYALMLEKAGDYKAMENELRRTLDLAPDFKSARVALVKYMLMTGRPGDAVALLQESKDVLNDARLSRMMSIALRKENDIEGAIKYAHKAFELMKNNLNLLNLASLEWRKGLKEKVFAELNAWLEEYPDDISTRNYLAALYLEADDTDNALAHYRLSIEQNPDQEVVLNNRAWLLRESDPKRATEYIMRALELAPQNKEIQRTKEEIESKKVISIDGN